MRKPVLSLFLILIAFQSTAQLAFSWAKGVEGFSNNPCCQQVQGTQVLPYKGSNVYMAGLFNNRADFNPGPGVDSQVNFTHNLNSFLSKYDSAGNYIWTHQAPGRGAYALDTAGNIYIAGVFDTTRDFDPGAAVMNLTPVHNDLYLMKLDKNYNLLWAKNAGTCNAEFQVMDVRVSAAGDIYAGGFFSGSVDFNPTASLNGTTNFQGNVRDGFLVKYSNSGTFQWASDVYGGGGDAVYQIALDASGNPLITGYTGYGFNVNTTVFKGSGTPRTIIADLDHINAFVAKYSSSGAVQWAKAARGSDCSGSTIAVDNTGTVYFGGAFSGTVQLDSATSGSSVTASGGATDAYLAKLSASGSYQWSKVYGSSSDDAVYGVRTDTGGDVYVTGMYSAAINLNPGGTAMTATNNGYRDGFIARYTSAGAYKWSTYFGSIYHDEPAALEIARDGSLYTTGYVSTSLNFNTGGTPGGQVTFLHTLTGQTYQPNAYLARYALPKTNTGIAATTDEGSLTDVIVYPNPGSGNFVLKGRLTSAGNVPLQIVISNSLGQMVYSTQATADAGLFEKELRLSNQLRAGIYSISISSSGAGYTQKLVIIR